MHETKRHPDPPAPSVPRKPFTKNLDSFVAFLAELVAPEVVERAQVALGGVEGPQHGGPGKLGATVDEDPRFYAGPTRPGCTVTAVAGLRRYFGYDDGTVECEGALDAAVPMEHGMSPYATLDPRSASSTGTTSAAMRTR